MLVLYILLSTGNIMYYPLQLHALKNLRINNKNAGTSGTMDICHVPCLPSLIIIHHVPELSARDRLNECIYRQCKA